MKKIQAGLSGWFAERYLRPQFRSLGEHPVFLRPGNVHVFGYNVSLGDHALVIASPDAHVNFISWAQADLEELAEIINGDSADPPGQEKGKAGQGEIRMGNYVLVCPGVRVHAATSISIGNSVMLAHSSYVTDSDWHGIYDRALPVGRTAPVVIEDNVWIGDRAVVCKGVRIGKNSIVGAGSVVRKDIPENCIAAGNPAEVVRELDPDRAVTGREAIYKDFARTHGVLEEADRQIHEKNTWAGWLRYLLFPKHGD